MSTFERTILGPVWVTKYALTRGILRFETMEQVDGCMVVHRPSPGTIVQWFCTTDWHLTEEAARAQVRAMAKKKLKSIEAKTRRLSLLLAGEIKTTDVGPTVP